MSQFDRRLDRLDALCAQPMAALPQWWKDLLSLWRPSGTASDDYGLRLAIRNDYFNFYRRGQSIAEVRIGKTGVPKADIHIKYVRPPAAEPYGAQCLTLDGDGWLRSKGNQVQQYGGLAMLKTWIRNIDGMPHGEVLIPEGNDLSAADDGGFTGREKEWVDQLVAHNSAVVDLEMGLPAFDENRRAPRMDCVALEQSAEGLRVVFWEAKLVTDGRMRTSEEICRDRPNEKPEVLRQLADYRDFLGSPIRRARVGEAYVRAAILLQQLREMANKVGPKYELGKEIRAAATGVLQVDCEARLVVFNPSKKSAMEYLKRKVDQSVWAYHAKRLRIAGVKVLVLDEADFTLRLPEPMCSE